MDTGYLLQYHPDGLVKFIDTEARLAEAMLDFSGPLYHIVITAERTDTATAVRYRAAVHTGDGGQDYGYGSTPDEALRHCLGSALASWDVMEAASERVAIIEQGHLLDVLEDRS